MMLVIYLSVVVFLFFNIKNLDLLALTDKFSKKPHDTAPSKRAKSPLHRDSAPDPAFHVPDNLHRAKAGTRRKAPLVFYSLEEVLAYAATLDGTLNSAKPILPYFTGS